MHRLPWAGLVEPASAASSLLGVSPRNPRLHQATHVPVGIKLGLLLPAGVDNVDNVVNRDRSLCDVRRNNNFAHSRCEHRTAMVSTAHLMSQDAEVKVTWRMPEDGNLIFCGQRRM